MKVLQVYEKPVPLESPGARAAGGVHAYLATLIGGLEARGWQVPTLRLARPGTAPEVLAGPPYTLASASLRPSPGTRRGLARLLEREAPDVVHIHSLFHAVGPGLLDWLARAVPVVCTLHEVAPLCFWKTRLMSNGRLCDRAVGIGCLTCGCYRIGGAAPPLKDLARIALQGRHLDAHRRLPCVVVPSRFMADQLALNRFDGARVRVVPHPSPLVPTAAPGPPVPRRLLFVGRLTAGKGVRLLLEALARLRAPGWQAVLVGEGPLAADLARRIEAMGLAPRVRLAGGVEAEALADHYREASVVVMPSVAPESFGLAGLEAMAHGRPVVAFPSGGVTEWLEDGVTGLLAARGDAGALAAALDRLLADPALAGRLGANGAAAAARRFGLDAHLDRILALYAERRTAMASRA
jgi:glycosyltransferase involved in cell wall biosynthesis